MCTSFGALLRSFSVNMRRNATVHVLTWNTSTRTKQSRLDIKSTQQAVQTFSSTDCEGNPPAPLPLPPLTPPPPPPPPLVLADRCFIGGKCGGGSGADSSSPPPPPPLVTTGGGAAVCIVSIIEYFTIDVHKNLRISELN